MIAGWHRNVAWEGVWPPSLRSHSWQTSSPTPYRSNSAASDVDLARFGLRIIRAMQPSTAAADESR